MQYFNGLSVHSADWVGWIKLPKHPLDYEAVFDVDAFKSAMQKLTETAPSEVRSNQKLHLDNIGCVLELYSDASSSWTKVERLQSIGFGIRDLCKVLLNPASEILGEEAVLLKDKVNVNPPGHTGFPVHQDFESYRHYPPNVHITVMIPLGNIDNTNGCMFFANNFKSQLTPEDVVRISEYGPVLRFIEEGPGRGNVARSVSRKYSYTDVEMLEGEALFFDSFVPHGSRDNAQSKSRLALFLTFCSKKFGFGYNEYYSQRYGLSK